MGSQTAKEPIMNIGSDIRIGLDDNESNYNLVIIDVSKKEINEIQNRLKDMSLTYEVIETH